MDPTWGGIPLQGQWAFCSPHTSLVWGGYREQGWGIGVRSLSLPDNRTKTQEAKHLLE